MANAKCTLTYTIETESEACRVSLEDALAIDGWTKTGNAQQTHWTGTFNESRFIVIEDGEKKWASRIRKMFLEYFSELDARERVNVTFVIQIGNLGWRAITVSGTTPNLTASVGAIEKG